MASKKRKVVEPAASQDCIGCEVLVQKDAMNEQNITFHRQEMAERWRLQEECNKTIQAGIVALNAAIQVYLDAARKTEIDSLKGIHKLEKSVMYAAVTVVASGIVTIAAAVMVIVFK